MLFILYGLSAITCRSPGRTRATTSRAWSAISTSRSKAYSASAVDVSSTLIILFTIYGAVLNVTGAGKFYIDFSFAAMGGKPAAAGRTWSSRRSCSAGHRVRAWRRP